MPNNRTKLWLRHTGLWAFILVAITVAAVPGRALAAGNDFNVQVSPSPLVVKLTPGKPYKATLDIRNASNHPETLYPKLNGFTIDKSSRDVRLIETVPAGLQDWTSFGVSSIAIPAGATKKLDVVFNTPPNVGFNYSAAITLSRKPDDKIVADGVNLRGSIAVFCLINIDRADAKRQLSVSQFSSTKSQYQYLPADFDLTIANSGNVIDAPRGTLFIQRNFDSTEPIATIPLNTGGNYILPGTERTFTASWNSGFPSYTTDENGNRHLTWDWKKMGELRFGRYVAKVVMVYNDGTRDVPLLTSYTFWVIPWTLIGILLVVLTILAMGIIGWGRLIFKGTRKVKSYAQRK